MSAESSETHAVVHAEWRERRCGVAGRQICVLRTVCGVAGRQIDWMCNSSSDCRGRVQARSSRRSRHSTVLEREAGLCYGLCATNCVLGTVCYSLCATAPPVPSRLLQACVQHHHCRRLSLGSPPFQVFALLLLLLLLLQEEEEVETTCSSGTVGQLPSAQQQQGAPGQREAADSAPGCSRQRSLKPAARCSHLCSALT